MTISRIAGCIALSAVTVTACTQETGEGTAENHLGTAVVSRVNGEPIYESVFRLYARNRTQKNADDLSAEENELVTDELVQLLTLAQEARKQGIDEERAIAAQNELQSLNLLARTLLNRYRENNQPTELELREAYDSNLEQLSAPQYKARHILVNEEEKATEIIATLKGGADFAEQARQHSTGPTGPNGGDLGWFDAGTMVKPFADAVRIMEKGTFTNAPVQTRFGWHVILLEDVKEGVAPGLEAVREQLTNTVLQEKMEAYVNGLKEAAAVTAATVEQE